MLYNDLGLGVETVIWTPQNSKMHSNKNEKNRETTSDFRSVVRK